MSERTRRGYPSGMSDTEWEQISPLGAAILLPIEISG